jgi:hypothetical protein
MRNNAYFYYPKSKSLHRNKTPLGVLYRHLPQTLSHDFLQKVRGYVVRLTTPCEDNSNESLQKSKCGTGLQTGLPLPRLHREMLSKLDRDPLDNRLCGETN